MPTSITIVDGLAELGEKAAGTSTVVVVAPASALQDGSAFGLPTLRELVGPGGLQTLLAMGAQAGGGSVGGSTSSSLLPGDGPATKAMLVPLPEEASRSYSPTHAMAIAGGLSSALGGGGKALVLVLLGDRSHLMAAAAAIGRACPLYSRKTSGASGGEAVVAFATAAAPKEVLEGPGVAAVAPLGAAAVQLAARLVDIGLYVIATSQYSSTTLIPNLRTLVLTEAVFSKATILGYDPTLGGHALRGHELRRRGGGGPRGPGSCSHLPPPPPPP